MSQAPMAGRPMMAPQRVSPGVYRNAGGGLQHGAGNPLAQAIARRPMSQPPANPSGWMTYKPNQSWQPTTQPSYRAMPMGGIGNPFGQANKIPEWTSQIQPQPWVKGIGSPIGSGYPTGGPDYSALIGGIAKRMPAQPAGQVGYSANYQGGNF